MSAAAQRWQCFQTRADSSAAEKGIFCVPPLADLGEEWEDPLEREAKRARFVSEALLRAWGALSKYGQRLEARWIAPDVAFEVLDGAEDMLSRPALSASVDPMQQLFVDHTGCCVLWHARLR